MSAVNIRLMISESAQGRRTELSEERLKLIKRLEEVQTEIGLIELHMLIEGIPFNDDDDSSTGASGASSTR